MKALNYPGAQRAARRFRRGTVPPASPVTWPALRHPGFVVIQATSSWGRGGPSRFVGQPIDAATLARFVGVGGAA